MNGKRAAARIAAGELAATGLLVLVAFLSGLARAELGMVGIEGAVVGSLAFGLGCGLIIATFGPLSKAQANPLVSVLASICGGQSWAQTAVCVASQIVGAAAAFAAVVTFAPALVANGSAEVRPLADGVAAFGFLLVAVGVAQRRSARVPLALGAFATASFWMTGRASLGNPLVSIALAGTKHLTATGACWAFGGSGVGSALAAAVAWFMFPQARASFGLVVYAPRPTRSDIT